MIRNYRKVKGRKIAIFITLIGITMLSLAIAVFWYSGWKRCLLEKQKLEDKINSYSRMIYVAAQNLPKGTVLTADKLNLEMRYIELNKMNFITEKEFGKTLLFDVEEGNYVTTQMLCAEPENGKEVFLAEIDFQDYVQAGDRIDVRIRYENAEDYTVLADKIVKLCDVGNGIVLELTEEEILYVSSAITDKQRYERTSLYAVKYPEYNNIITGVVSYIPNREILTLLDREKTEGEGRDALEKRLMRMQ